MSIRVGKETVKEIDMSVLKPVVAEPVKEPAEAKQEKPEKPVEPKVKEPEVKEPTEKTEVDNGKDKTKKGK